MKPTITVETRHYITCPVCGAEGRDGVGGYVDHLFGKNGDYRWNCNKCQREFKFWIVGDEVTQIEATGKLNVPSISLLRLERDARPLLVLVSGKFYDEEPGKPGEHRDKTYLYEQHWCPTNITQDIEVVLDGTDNDRHGLFSYIGSVEAPEGIDFCNISAEEIVRLFKNHAPALLGIDTELDNVVAKVLREEP